MRAVLQRVKSASVSIEGRTAGAIGPGFLVLLGVAPEDTQEECDFLLDKVLGLRVFEDEAGKMNRSLCDCGGSLLVVSQLRFTRTAARAAAPPSPGPPGRRQLCRSTNVFLQGPDRRAFPPNAGNSVRTCWSAWKTTAL